MRSFLLFVCCLLSASLALAGGVFKWTDAEGNVHYGDRPAAGPGSVAVRVSTKAGRLASPVARVQAKPAAANSSETTPQPTKAELRKKAREEAAARATRCQEAKDRLQSYVQSQRLYRLDDAGERVYLDEEQIQAARDTVQERVEENCGPA